MSLSILVVARWYPSHDLPGRGTFVADLVRALTAAGAGVVVASFETTQWRAERAGVAAVEAGWAAAVADPAALTRPRSWGAGAPVARLPVVRTWASGADLDRVEQADRHAAILRPFVRSLATRLPIDIIHAHTGLPDGVAAAAVADELGVPLLVTEHDSTLVGRLDADPRALEAYRSLLDGRHRVVAPSPSLATALTERLHPAGPIDVIANPVPTDAFPLGPEAGRRPDELLWVGTRAAHKGIDRLLRAFALTRAERPGLRLRLIGGAPDGDDGPWHQLADELAVADAVSFEPAVDRAGVAAAMRRAGLFVHPSPFETFGMVAAEALASGLPVVASPSGGVEAIVGRDGTAGVIAASLEPADLAAAIAAALARRATFRPDLLRARVEERFGAPVVAERTLAAYADLLGTDLLETDRPRTTTPPLVAEAAGRGIAAVVALHRSGAARVAALPAAARAGLAVVTNLAPARELDGAGARIVIPAGRVPSAGSSVVARLRRSLAPRAATPATGAPPTSEAAAIRSVAGAGDAAAPVWIVAADADDVAAIGQAVGSAALAPGSIRWLADSADETAGEPGAEMAGEPGAAVDRRPA